MLGLSRFYSSLLILLAPLLLVRCQEEEESLAPLRTHSIYAPYVDQDLQNRWFDFGGDAYVNTNKHIRLTQDRSSENGWVWSRLPITVSSYQIEIEFKISGGSSHLFGDGMAIWLTKTRAEYGPVFGQRDNFEGLGIFFDTYANSRHSYSFPRIMAMLGDGRTSYDLGQDGEQQSAGACSAAIRRNDIKTMIRIIYKKGESLVVKLQYKGWDEWTTCFEIPNVTLPSMPYLGVSAITGQVHDNHDLVSITSSTITTKPNLDFAKIKDKKWKKKPERTTVQGYLSSVLKLMAFGAFCGGAYWVYLVYYVQDGRWSNKRF